MADMVAADGKKMTIGISVDGSDIAAYACNGTDDEAWFFGNQTDGKVDIKSRFRDALRAEFDGNEVTGEVTMNEVEYDFTANAVSGVAGMYTAESRVSAPPGWCVPTDRRREFSSAASPKTGTTNIDPFNLDGLTDFQVRHDVRNKRNLKPAAPIEFLSGKPQSSINGVPVTPTLVTGTFRLG